MSKQYHFDVTQYESELRGIISTLLSLETITERDVEKIVRKYPKDTSQIFSKDNLVSAIQYFLEQDEISGNGANRLLDRIKMKPTRTMSGVTTVTVLTKPFACPGKCIFCPNDVRMPKSYIATEPGAQRALANRFSPYLQTWNRLQALKNIGHPTEKIELLVLGGTWSSYPEQYQIWFISECFRAMNEFGGYGANHGKDTHLPHDQEGNIPNTTLTTVTAESSPLLIRGKGVLNTRFKYEGVSIQLQKYLSSDWNDTLREKVGDLEYNELIQTDEFKDHFAQFLCSEDSALPRTEAWQELRRLHAINATAKTRCVGLVLETRPDAVREREALRLRKLGATKIQLGIQTLDDEVSRLNKRGEGRLETSRAFRLLRAAGFKVHAHMMPNLYGATPEIDRRVYKQLFTDPVYKPDEVKIYPTSTIKYTELHDKFLSGEYEPYDTETLIDLMADMLEMTPEYCRLTRIIRDIPSTEIEAGNKTTNLREVVERKLAKEGRKNPNIRAREIKNKQVSMNDLQLEELVYETSFSTEIFLQYITSEREIAGFLRLSLPKEQKNPVTAELDHCAMIREVHVYGPSLELQKSSSGEAQHLGLGSKLIERAKKIATEKSFEKLAVISAIGTREYYEKRGFTLAEEYQIWENR